MSEIAQADHSRFVQRVRRRYGQELAQLAPGRPTPETLRDTVSALQARGRDLGVALRVTRQLVLERLAVMDVEQQASLDDVTLTMTDLAEVSLDLALAQAIAEADERHGPAVNDQGQRIEFWIVGMGKLGARELNVSSDIDLIYVYEEQGHTHGSLRVSAHEYFSWVVRRLYNLIG